MAPQYALPLLLLLPAIAVSGQAPLSSAPEILHVHGTVINAITHAPISHALVTSADQRMALLSDANGRFEFDVKIPRGDANASSQGGVTGGLGNNVYLLARKPGYRNMQYAVMVALQASTLSHGDAGARSNEVQLKLMPAAILTGHVTAPGIGATADVNVQLFERVIQDGIGTWQTAGITQTSAGGAFRIGELGPGEYKLLTQEWVEQTIPTKESPGMPLIGYPPLAYPTVARSAPYSDDVGSTRAKGIRLSGGQTTDVDLRLHATPYFPITIPVTQDAAVNGVNVTVRRADAETGFALSFNLRTQQVEGSLPDGLYHVTLQVFGNQQTSGNEPRVSFGTGDLLVAGKPARGAPIAILPGANIPVTVRKEYTVPDPNAPGSPIMIKEVGPPPVSVADAIAAHSQALQPRSVQVILHANDSSLGDAILRNPQPGESGDDGLLIENVHPGSYRVSVSSQFGYASSVTADGIDLLRQPLVITSAAAPTIAITLRNDVAAIKGTVPGISQNQSEPNFIAAYPLGEKAAAQNIAQGFLAPDGTFTMSLPPGTYLLLPGTARLRNIEYRNEEAMRKYESLGTVVTLSPGQTVTVTLKAPTSEAEPAEEGIE